MERNHGLAMAHGFLILFIIGHTLGFAIYKFRAALAKAKAFEKTRRRVFYHSGPIAAPMRLRPSRWERASAERSRSPVQEHCRDKSYSDSEAKLLKW